MYVYVPAIFAGMSTRGTFVVTTEYWLTGFDGACPGFRLGAAIFVLKSFPPTSCA